MAEEIPAATPQVTPQASAEAAATVTPTEVAKPVAEVVTPPTEVAKPADAAAEAAKPADGEKPADAKPSDEKVVPESYDLKLSEGSKLDKSALEKIALEAKEKGLSQEEAQGLVARDEKVVSDFHQKQQDQLATEVKGWVKELQDDKTFGGSDANYKANAEIAHRAFTHYAPPEFVNLMDSTGLGNHPALVRTFHKIGLEMASDKAVLPRTAGVSPEVRAADVLFPTSKKK